VSLHEGTLLAMPFDSGAFDVVIVNQVLHHLDTGTSDTWPHLRQALAECRRVLRAGGVLLLNTCTHQQVRAGYWYVALIPKAAERLVQRYPSIETLSQLLTELDFEPRATLAPIDASFGGQRYLDPGGPFDPRWRNGDSIWSLVTDRELDAALSKLRALHDAGTVAAFVREHDQQRQSIGQATFLPAWRR
jgi:SAM-dependent methyltransferase